MTTKRILGKSLGLILTLALFLGGCAGTNSVLDVAGQAYKHNVDQMMSSPNQEEWNATDWSLWMNSQGGG